MKKVQSKKKICFALQGGGTYGAFNWGILDKFLEDERFEIDAISATSAGSVNAVLLAYGLEAGNAETAREILRDFWYTFSKYGYLISPVKQSLPFEFFNIDITAQASAMWFDAVTRTFSPYVLNPFNINPIRSLLEEKIDFSILQKAKKIKVFLCATNVKTGRLKIFSKKELSIDTVMASTCLPNIMQAVKVEKDYYWDGGYLANPAIFPLIYNSAIDDIIILHNSPIKRDILPYTSAEIANRQNEISFNSSLMRELRAVAFITKLIDEGHIKKSSQKMIRRKYIHLVDSDEVMTQFNIAFKFNINWDLLKNLYQFGREVATQWINENYAQIGKQSTIDLSSYT
jgi:NTE family protein